MYEEGVGRGRGGGTPILAVESYTIIGYKIVGEKKNISNNFSMQSNFITTKCD